MTWCETWARLWLFLRAHLGRQRICAACGDAIVRVELPLRKVWRCEACHEFAQLEREAMMNQQRDLAELRYANAQQKLGAAVSAPIPPGIVAGLLGGGARSATDSATRDLVKLLSSSPGRI